VLVAVMAAGGEGVGPGMHAPGEERSGSGGRRRQRRLAVGVRVAPAAVELADRSGQVEE